MPPELTSTTKVRPSWDWSAAALAQGLKRCLVKETKMPVETRRKTQNIFVGMMFKAYLMLRVFENTRDQFTTDDLAQNEDILKVLCVGATDKHRTSAFLA